MDTSLFLDNIIVRSFAGNYTSATLPKVLTDKLSLSSWGDRIEYVLKSLPLAMANGSFVYTNGRVCLRIPIPCIGILQTLRRTSSLVIFQ